MSIRSKILAGCLTLTLLTGLLGAVAQIAERQLGALALHIYDDAFMAVSYLRAAQIGFAGLAHDNKVSSQASEDLLGDLDVVRDRAMSPAGRSQAEALRGHLAETLARMQHDPASADPAAVQREFERVVETFADDGFRYRRGVGQMVAAQVRHTWIAIAMSVVAALTITMLISGLIVPPVRRAVRIAQAIAAGTLDNDIVASGRDETAALLRALASMQASIASALERIRALMAEQASTHAGQLATQHARMEAALDNMNQGLCLFDSNSRLAVVNRRFGEMFGTPVVGVAGDDLFAGHGLEPLRHATGAALVAALSCDLPDGRSIAVSQRPVAGGGWVATYEDISERRAAEARLAHMARHDLLTGLPNRLRFGEHLQHALAQARRGNGAAVLSLDLDRFKTVNDTLGHVAGDALLCAVAQRLRECTRESDLVARLGGDEFTIVQDSAHQPDDATALAQRLAEALSVPFDLDRQQVVIGVSIGIALTSDVSADDPLTDAEALLKCADLALYRAKHDGRGKFRFFEAEMDTRMQMRRALELDLRQALAEEQFELFYQPLMQSRGGIVGFEALLRWHHPQRGLVSPALFIPLAEEIGLIDRLGCWVMQRACADAARWPGALKVAVNLSPEQFRAGNIVALTQASLAASGLSSDRLELEITESVLLQEDQSVLETLHALRALGVRVAMDDFGTGYSSLSYLRRFPFDKIKIDQSFVRGMSEEEDCHAIVRAVIGLGRSLRISVNAEGVETPSQLAALREQGCAEMQGYLFSKPRPVGEIDEMLRRHGNATIEPEVEAGSARTVAKAPLGNNRVEPALGGLGA